jgi:hypothetical protein
MLVFDGGVITGAETDGNDNTVAVCRQFRQAAPEVYLAGRIDRGADELW